MGANGGNSTPHHRFDLDNNISSSWANRSGVRRQETWQLLPIEEQSEPQSVAARWCKFRALSIRLSVTGMLPRRVWGS
jgi:hypothetical protein